MLVLLCAITSASRIGWKSYGFTLVGFGRAARTGCTTGGYYGFKVHVIINLHQQVVGFSLPAANIDERDALDNVRGHITGLIIGDKGLLSQAELALEGINV